MREIRKSGSEGGAGQTNVPFLPLSGNIAAADSRKEWYSPREMHPGARFD